MKTAQNRIAFRGAPLTEERYRKALSMWLRWNDAHEEATTQMFSAGRRVELIEDVLDQIDQLRHEAVLLSRQLLD